MHLSFPSENILHPYQEAVIQNPTAERFILDTQSTPPRLQVTSILSGASISLEAPQRSQENRAIVDHFLQALTSAYGERMTEDAFSEDVIQQTVGSGLSSRAIIQALNVAANRKRSIEDSEEVVERQKFLLRGAVRNLRLPDISSSENETMIARAEDLFETLSQKETFSSSDVDLYYQQEVAAAKAQVAKAIIATLKAKFFLDQAASDSHAKVIFENEEKNLFLRKNTNVLTDPAQKMLKEAKALFNQAAAAEKKAVANLHVLLEEKKNPTWSDVEEKDTSISTTLTTDVLKAHQGPQQAKSSDHDETSSVSSDNSYVTADEE